jgi:hypothetical protein
MLAFKMSIQVLVFCMCAIYVQLQDSHAETEKIQEKQLASVSQPFVDERSSFLENCKVKIRKIKINCPLPPFQS